MINAIPHNAIIESVCNKGLGKFSNTYSLRNFSKIFWSLFTSLRYILCLLFAQICVYNEKYYILINAVGLRLQNNFVLMQLHTIIPKELAQNKKITAATMNNLKLMTHGQEICASFRTIFYIYVLTSNLSNMMSTQSHRNFLENLCKFIARVSLVIINGF